MTSTRYAAFPLTELTAIRNGPVMIGVTAPCASAAGVSSHGHQVAVLVVDVRVEIDTRLRRIHADAVGAAAVQHDVEEHGQDQVLLRRECLPVG